MVAVYSDASPPLEDVYRQLLNFIEVYEYNGSGWVFSNFASLQLTSWHLDPLRASAFVPLPRWIREKKAVVNVTGTGDDCFKWAVLAGMHPVGKRERNSNRMDRYAKHVSKYDFSSLHYPVPSFAKTNNLSINVYGVEDDKKVKVIPQNMENYLSLTVGQLKFIDSFPQGLDKLAKTLGDDEFRYLSESYISNHFGLIRRKGVYPYDYMDSFDRFEETELPSQDAFFSKLSGSPCSDSEYTHAARVWDAFGCKTIADYHDIYLQLDVLLLADFFEKFRVWNSIALIHCIITLLPVLRGILLLECHVLIFISQQMITCREQYSMIFTRHAKANSHSFPATYDASLPKQNLIYLDANNLHGWKCHRKCTHGSRFLQQEENLCIETA